MYMKIGIVTHYYKSVNYGGNLQAYALCKVLEEMGHQPEQLQIDMVQGSRIKAPLRLAARCLLPRYRKKHQWKRNTQKRLEKAFHRFNRQLTPHSAAVYTSKNIQNALACYDTFITGSDQVWNPIWYFPPFFLEFAPSTTPKLSYAASIGQTRLTKAVADRYRAHLKDFIGVSVREQDAVALLEGIAPETATWVLDPTLLLRRDQWLTVAEPTPIETPYVFCYFLGNDPVARQTAAKRPGSPRPPGRTPSPVPEWPVRRWPVLPERSPWPSGSFPTGRAIVHPAAGRAGGPPVRGAPTGRGHPPKRPAAAGPGGIGRRLPFADIGKYPRR